MEDLIGKKFEIFDHGYIILRDVFGSDEEIVNAARISYQKGTTKKRGGEGLIDFLMRHSHTSPFEMPVLRFEIKLPIFVERQWVRHRTCSMNEMSARYSELPEEYYVPHERVVGAQSKSNKQVRDVTEDIRHPHAEIFRQHVRENSGQSFTDYKEDLDKGIARELARVQLPLGTYTVKVWQMNLHNLLHFLRLRLDSHAQYEIRQYAKIIERIVENYFPATYASWHNHIKEAVSLSADEQRILGKTIYPDWPVMLANNEQFQALSKTRQKELLDKVEKLYYSKFMTNDHT